MKLTISKMTESLNVTEEVLKQMEISGNLVPKRDKRGRRFYSEQQLETARSYLSSQKDTFEIKEKSISEKIQEAVFQLAKGLTEMQEKIENRNWNSYSNHWIRASQSLLRLSLELNCPPFPTNFFDQYPYWIKPLPQWEIPFFSELFSSPWWEEEEQILLQPNGKLSLYCEELAESWMPNKERHLEHFLTIQNDCRERLKDQQESIQANLDYCDCRSFFVPANAVLNREVGLARAFFSVPEKYRTQMNRVYESIPPDYVVNGQVYLCPYCGWTLKPKKGDWECATRKCRRIVEKYSKWKAKTIKYHDSLCRVKQGILEYILIPGIPEHRIYTKLNQIKHLTVQLYPDVDACDLRIQFPNRRSWIIDVKDWTYPHQLVKNLKENPPFQGFSEDEQEHAFIVIPRHYDQEYMNRLRQGLRDSDLLYKAIHERELYKEIEREFEESANYT